MKAQGFLQIAVFLLSFLLTAGTNARGGSTNCVPQRDSLVSWWSFDGNFDDHLNTGGNTYTNNPLHYASGVSEQAISFPGNTYIQTRDYPGSDLLDDSGFTFETWVLPAPDDVHGPIMTWWWDSNGRKYGVGWFIYSGAVEGQLSFWIDLYETNGTRHVIEGFPDPLDLATFQHLALTYDRPSGWATVFVAGVELLSTNLGSIFIRPPNQITFGGYQAINASYFLGLMDETALYSEALSAEAIAQIYQAGAASRCRVPTPPGILEHPHDLLVHEGGAARFDVRTTGGNMTYQWNQNGIPIAGAQSRVLQLDNIPFSQSGSSFSVTVSNEAGIARSTLAQLEVTPYESCAVLPPGLVAWWPLDGSWTNIGGPAEAVIEGAPGFENGVVGGAMASAGAGCGLVLPIAPEFDMMAGGGFTIEFWIQPTSVEEQALLDWRTDEQSLAPMAFIFYGALVLWPRGGWSPGAMWTEHGSIKAGEFQHIAITYEPGVATARLFVNGTEMISGDFAGLNIAERGALKIGTTRFGGTFNGLMDEISIYSRALTESELHRIYVAGASGKCQSISTPLGDTSAFESTQTSLTTTAAGAGPFSYEWLFNGVTIPGASSNTLILDPVQLDHAGHYTVLVEGASGRIDRSSAILTVKPGLPENRVSIELDGTQTPVLMLKGLPDNIYSIEGSENLLDWVPLGNATPMGGGYWEFIHNAHTGSNRFYRAVSSPE